MQLQTIKSTKSDLEQEKQLSPFCGEQGWGKAAEATFMEFHIRT